MTTSSFSQAPSPVVDTLDDTSTQDIAQREPEPNLKELIQRCLLQTTCDFQRFKASFNNLVALEELISGTRKSLQHDVADVPEMLVQLTGISQQPHAPNPPLRRHSIEERHPISTSDMMPDQDNAVSFGSVYDPVKGTNDPIVEHPVGSGQFYIFRCKSHNFTIPASRSPQGSAIAHMRCYHKGRGSSLADAVDAMGIKVKGCTSEKLLENNESFYASHGQHYKKRGNPAKSGKRKPPERWPTAPSKRRKLLHVDSDSIKTGTVYIVKWLNGKNVPVVIVPIFDVSWPKWRRSVLNTAEALGLYESNTFKEASHCFELDEETAFPRSWGADYLGGGCKSQHRKYPVVYIGKSWDVRNTSIGWVEATKLWEYDAEKVAECSRGVDDYHEKMDAARSEYSSCHYVSRPNVT